MPLRLSSCSAISRGLGQVCNRPRLGDKVLSRYSFKVCSWDSVMRQNKGRLGLFHAPFVDYLELGNYKKPKIPFRFG